MFRLDLYLNGTRLDLYEKDSINLVRKATDFVDIDKVYNDYTKSFTVPATPTNNQLFGYYYDPNNSGSFDPFANNTAEMFINQNLYSEGTIKLESVVMGLDGVDSYSITFYSDVIALKNTLNDATIKDLDWSAYNHSNSTTTVRNALNGSSAINGNMWYAPISIERYWQYGDSSPADIGTAGGAIHVNEVRPFVPVSTVIDKIFDLAGHDYIVNMAGDAEYDNLQLWMNNGTEKGSTSPDMRYSIGQLQAFRDSYTTIRFDNVIRDNFGLYNIGNGEFVVPVSGSYRFDFQADTTIQGTVTIRCFQNGTGVGLTLGLSSSNTSGFLVNTYTAGDVVTFRATGSTLLNNLAVLPFGSTVKMTSAPSAVGGTVYVNSLAPEITCIDFLGGILKLFNGIIYFDRPNQRFVIDRRSSWYDSGSEKDITPYVDLSSVTVSPPSFYKLIDFSWQDPEDFLNLEFKRLNNRTYGNSSYDVGSKFGGEYKIELPFTNTIMTDINPNNGLYCSFIVALDSDAASEPTAAESGVRLFYKNSNSTSVGTYYVTDGGTTTGQNNIVWVSSVLQGTSDRVLSFTEEIGEDGTIVSDSILTEEYNSYLQEIYRGGVRRFSIDAWLPQGVIENTKLNDTFVIQNTIYLIDEMTINLKDGRAKLKLINKGTQ